MSTLLLRLAAPLQAWGVDSKFERRATARVPTKSGVVGLIAAALGRRRDENIGDLQKLRFGVRVDQEGMLLRDYHTAKSQKSAYVTHRYYLADAVFLAGLEGADAFLQEIEHALSYPVFPLFLGRRSCPPEGRLSLGVRTGKTLLEALQDEPWLLSEWLRVKENYQVHLRIVAEAGADGETDAETDVETDVEPRGSYFQRDLPLSFDQTHRKFGFRHVFEFESQSVYNPLSRRAMSENSTGHDPMPELEGE